jgi:hypothetical protein
MERRTSGRNRTKVEVSGELSDLRKEGKSQIEVSDARRKSRVDALKPELVRQRSIPPDNALSPLLVSARLQLHDLVVRLDSEAPRHQCPRELNPVVDVGRPSLPLEQLRLRGRRRGGGVGCKEIRDGAK